MNDINIGEQGRLRFTNFVKAIDEIVKGGTVDHLVSGGNSGISLSEITLMILELLDCKTPSVLRVPFYRYYPPHRDDENFKFDPKYYKEQINEYIMNTRKAGTFLFVDDEICQGNTALGIKRLLDECLQENHTPRMDKYYIVAEDQGFRVPSDLSNIIFKPIAKEIDGYNNLIFTFIPYEFEKPLVDYFGDDEKLAFHIRANLLLNLPVKEFSNGSPMFSTILLDQAKANIKDFQLLQNRFRDYVKGEISKILFSNN